MDVVAELDAPCAPEVLYAWVDDLDRYPDWLDIVSRAERLEDHAGPIRRSEVRVAHDAPEHLDGTPDHDLAAWAIDLRGRLGPLARSKRLRMVRTVRDHPSQVVFERHELDGRDHSTWRLSADVEATGDGARLRMVLHYGGSLFGPVLERFLRDEIEQSKVRLLALVTEA